MMKKNISLLTRCLAAAALGFAAQTANAQVVPDIQESITRGSQVDDVIRAQESIASQAKSEDNAIDGEAGIFILTKNDIFYVGASLGTGYTSNPVRTADNAEGTFSADFAAAAGVQTAIAGSIDFGANVSVSGTEYADSLAPSSRSVSSSVSAGTQIRGTPLYASVTGFGGFSYDGHFENGTAFYGASGSLSAGFPLGKKAFIRPGIGITRQWSGVKENNSTTGAASVDLLYAVAPKLTLTLNGRISRVWFDDFYEDVIFVKRNDWQYSGGLSANLKLAKNANIGVSAGVEKRNSAFFLSEYENFEAGLTFSLRVRF